MEKYEAIIFDLGGVIINLNYELTIQEFSKICEGEFTQYSQKQQTPLFDDLETGRITPQEFRESFRKIFRTNASDEQIDMAWNAMLLDIPKERINFLRNIGKNKRIFLLSNTNQIHFEAFNKILFEAHQIHRLDSLFEKAYYSHQVGLRKPSEEIFRFVLEENNLLAEKTLFIDDSLQHIIGANKIGINALHLVSPQTILDLEI